MTGHGLCPMGLVQYNIMLGHTQFIDTFIVCKNLQKECVIRWDMQHLHHSGCALTERGHLLSHQGAQLSINSIDTVMDEAQL